jgi:hypothetical protein
VTDLLTNEPIPFANVTFKGTTTGASANMDGAYVIETSRPGDSLTASFIGYKPVTLKIAKGKTQVINFSLSVNRMQLNEVVIKAGENPAHILLRKIIENKQKNDKENIDEYNYEAYNKMEFDLSNLTDEFKNKKAFKPVAFIFKNIDSSETNKKPFLPIFVSESISDVYYRKSPTEKKEVIKASKVSGVESGAINQFMGDMYQNINLYENYIMIFKKGFVSPISDYGLLYYKYYLVDSAFFDNQWCYKMKFKPRRKQELTFSGDMWVHDSTFAVRKINMRIAEDANINFIEDLAIIQDFRRINGESWMKTRDLFVVDFLAQDDGMGFIGRKTTSYRNFNLHKKMPDGFYHTGEAVIIQNSASEKTAAFWQTARHDSLSKNERMVYHMVDTIKTLPIYRTALDIITMVVTGYLPFGKIEIGPYLRLYSRNSYEGHRFRLGVRTSNTFSTDLILEGFLAYGTQDKHVKYGGSLLYFLSKQPRTSVGLSYRYDAEEFGMSNYPFAGYRILGRGNENLFQGDNFINSVLRRRMTNKFNMIHEQKIHVEREWRRGISSKITWLHREIRPVGDLDFTYFSDDSRNVLRNQINASEIHVHSRFAFDEKFINGKRNRISLGSDWPIVQMNYTLGLKNVLGSQYPYHKFAMKIDDRVELRPFGYTLYIIEAGKTWGTLPFPLLEVHRGNETFNYNVTGFNMMNFYEFVSDQYLSVNLSHHFDGFFLDKIPLMRKLKWREVFNARAVIGSLSEENLRMDATGQLKDMLLNQKIRIFDRYTINKPYAEVGVAVENIFKVLRLDATWRLDYLKPRKAKNPGNLLGRPGIFALMASLQLTF